MVTLFWRTVIVYAFLVVAMRVGGKRQIGELQLSELVTALLLSELAVIPIGDESLPLLYAVIPILTVISLEIIITFAVTKSQLLKKLFDGRPSFIIKKGTLDQTELARLRMSVEELIAEARQKDICDLSDIQYAILEQNGKLSVFPKSAPDAERGSAHALIVDGNISDQNLALAGISRKTLQSALQASRIPLEDVFLFSINDGGEENLLLKSAKNPPKSPILPRKSPKKAKKPKEGEI